MIFSMETIQINHQSQVSNKIIKQRHIDALVCFSGLAADRPDGSSEVKMYWATDTGVLSIWNGSAWLSETFT